jgi:hypothetical protein
MQNKHMRSDRGSALLVVVILVAVLGVVALALVRRTTSELDSIGAKRNYDVAQECADGAREMLYSQFRTYGVMPADLQMDTNVGTKRYASGHYDQFNMKSVVVTTQTTSGTIGASDIVNRTGRSGLGGTVYRMAVVCSDASNPNRQSEVEFLVRFGL